MARPVPRSTLKSKRHHAIMGDSKDVLFDALNAESEELDTLLWTTPTTIGGLFALLELWEEIMKTRPDTLFSDYNEAQGDIGRDVARPAFGGVEADDAYGVVVLAGHQVLDDGFQIGRLEIGLAPHQAVSAEIVHHQVDIPIIVPGNDRRRPITQTRTPIDHSSRIRPV